MKLALACVVVLALSGCTLVGLGAGAGIGDLAGNTSRGAYDGACIGLVIDILLITTIHSFWRLLGGR